MAENRAAWFTKKGSLDMEVKEAPYPKPGDEEVVIQGYAVAVNPADWVIPLLGILVETYPTVLGLDVAGKIYEVGKNVTRFKKGDRVMAITGEFGAEGAGTFQLFSRTMQDVVVHIPDSLSFEDAAVIPLGATTASMAFYAPPLLAMAPFPSLSPTPTGKTVLVWGASGGVGQPAIQLAVASGYTVAAVASPHNAPALRALGAAWVFDHHDAHAVDTAVAALRGARADLVGALNLVPAEGAELGCAEIVARVVAPGGRKFVASVFARSDAAKRPAGVDIQFFNGGGIFKEHKEVGKAVFQDFLPQALVEGKFKAVPEAKVVGEGLESIQAAVVLQQKGVSAQKIVVKLV